MQKKDTATPITYAQLLSELEACGIAAGESLIVHTALSSLGWVVGGAEMVIRALMKLVEPDGTLMMPAQTWKNLDPSTGVHWEQPEEWWPLIRQNWPAYDPKITPVIGMGVAAEMFRTWPGTVRSNHPARSFSANGKMAQHLMENHDLQNIFGIGSPLHKLYELDGYILLIGVGYDKCTSLHLAESLADYPDKHTVTESSAMLIDGKRQWVSYDTLDVDDADFIQIGEAFDLAYHTKIHKVGQADVRLVSQRKLVNFAVKWMEEHR